MLWKKLFLKMKSQFTSPQHCHGSILASLAPTLSPPKLMVKSNRIARPGYATVSSSEYLDNENTLMKKVRIVADLMRAAQRPCLYTGAGMSTASGIGDYASEAAGEKSMVHRQRRVLPYSAQPTLSHRIFAQIGLSDDFQHLEWIQQNHDGLPQKAGYPQERLCEIHGAWYDPSNPVVAMSGSLRGDLFSRFEQSEVEADLVLALGTSLSGMNVDRMVTTPWSRGADTVIVALQRTQLDDQCSVRIFAKLDDFSKLLCEELGQTVPTEQVRKTYTFDGENEEEIYTVPYDNDTRMKLDYGTLSSSLHLYDGAQVKLTVGVHQGDVGEVVGRDAQGHYIIIFQHRLKKTSKLTRPFERRMGAWWVNHALQGEISQLPIVNV